MAEARLRWRDYVIAVIVINGLLAALIYVVMTLLGWEIPR